MLQTDIGENMYNSKQGPNLAQITRYQILYYIVLHLELEQTLTVI